MATLTHPGQVVVLTIVNTEKSGVKKGVEGKVIQPSTLPVKESWSTS